MSQSPDRASKSGQFAKMRGKIEEVVLQALSDAAKQAKVRQSSGGQVSTSKIVKRSSK